MSRRSSLPILFVVWCSTLGLACQMVSAQIPDASPADSTLPQLLHPAELIQQSSRVIGPEVMRRRAVGFDAEMLKTLDPGGDNQLVFNLFQNSTFTGRVEGKTFPGARIGFFESFSLRGSIQGISGSSFQLVYHQGVIAADIRIPGKGEYQIRPTAPGPPVTHEVWEIDNSRYPSCALGGQFQFNPLPADKAWGQSKSFSFDLGSRIDVMIVYTADARIVTGGTINTEAEALLAVSNTNAAYVNSLVNTQLFLVYLDEIAYSESGNASTDLNRLTNIGDGFLDSVHTIRDTVGADNVGLFVSSFDACGIAWLMTTVSPSFESSSFNVSAIGCAAGNLTYAHEVGHNLGCHHNRENANGVGAFPYSFGYRDPGLSFRTVLAASNGSPRIMQFSNPDVLVGGDPTGVPEGQANSADNAKTINNTSFTMANFRQAVCPDPLPLIDCNSNCIEDADDITFGSSLDCNTNNIPDECDVPSGFSADCNFNNIPDECEDCNGNGIADECEVSGTFSENSGILSPIGLGSDAIYTFVAPPLPTSDITFDFTASAELFGLSDFIEVFLNSMSNKIGEVFKSTGSACANPPDEDQIIMTQAAYDAIVGSDNAEIIMTGFLDPGACGGANFVTVNMSYGSPNLLDLNGNGIIDACECDADCAGTPDGNVNVTDLLDLLANWGGTPTGCDIAPPGGDGAVNVTDLLALLGAWGSCFTP